MKVKTPTAIPIMVPFPTPLFEPAVFVVELEEPEFPIAVADAFEDDDALVEAVMRCPKLVVDPVADIDP
jgi:hypothetical protein